MAHATPTLPPIVLTGPGGWVGSAFLATLADRLGPSWTSTVRLFGSQERHIQAPDGSPVPIRRLTDLSPADVEGAFVLHLAYLTKEKADSAGPRSFLDGNIHIDSCVMKAIASGNPAGLFVASSGAARLAEQGVDRHLYGMAKLMQEDAFAGFALRSGVPALIGRIYNLAGPFINKVHAYALSSFLTQAIESGVIRVSAGMPVYRSFLHVADLCELVLRSLVRGRPHGGAVDLCGPCVVEMGDIALAAARATGLNKEAIERPPLDLTRPSSYLGDPTPTLTLALETGLTLRNFATQVSDTASYLRLRHAGP